MTHFDRRALIRLLAASGATLAASGFLQPAFAWDSPPPYNIEENPKFAGSPFTLGVASGDPAADGFVIWTRLAPRPMEPHGGMILKQIPVQWEVAVDEGFRKVVQNGTAMAWPELGHAVHVEVEGLSPARPYWYRFRCGGEESPVGRSHTFPAAGSNVEQVRFVVAGCQCYHDGYFTAWRKIAEEPADFVFHYGDYIYEGVGANVRLGGGEPTADQVIDEVYSLEDYRRRYALYKLDPDLQAAHAAHPFFVSFDDHEIDNNWAAGIDENEMPTDVFALRRAIGFQAYYEHMPLRRSSIPTDGHIQMFRGARFGNLLNAFILDTRQYRSNQAYFDLRSPQGPDVYATDRTMLGDRQEQWLFDGLSNSDARWNLIAQQVLLLNLVGKRQGDDQAMASMDQWSGYLHSRRRLLDHIDKNRPGNVVTVSGDAHLHFAGDLIQDQGDDKIIASEFSATSITSGRDGSPDEGYLAGAKAQNPQLKAIVNQRGYTLCDVTPDVWHADMKVLDKVSNRNGTLSTYAAFDIDHGKPGLQRAS